MQRSELRGLDVQSGQGARDSEKDMNNERVLEIAKTAFPTGSYWPDEILAFASALEAALLEGKCLVPVDAERYKDYANVLRLFIEGVEWDSELPLDVWAICQHWNNNAAIDAARGEK